MAHDIRPTIALAMGDPCGISPELTAHLMALPAIRETMHLIVIGDVRVLSDGADIAKVAPTFEAVQTVDAIPQRAENHLFVDLGTLDPATITRGSASQAGGTFALANFRAALDLAKSGRVSAVTFTPFNKAAMRMADPAYDDEISFVARACGTTSPASEFNILDGLWNARVTSHIALKDVAERITTEAVLRGLQLTDASMKQAGYSTPRIALAALNPHGGDNGNFGREEIDILEPAVAAAKRGGLAVEGPFPADTVFVRAKAGQFDAVLTLYHDQGQIAMKLMGFDRGVTLLGGFPFPICTPAHGTAYEIAGKGIANTGAACAALLLAARLASHRTRTAT